MTRLRPLLLWSLLAATPAAAQAPAEHLALGDSLADLLLPQAALEHYELAIAGGGSHAAYWKAAGAVIDIAKQLTGEPARAQRDSLYLVAQGYAESAIAADSLGADGHFMLAQALGRLARTKGGKDRVRYGRRIYDEAARALALNPDHDGAHHVLGAWHAEVKRLSNLTRTIAKLFLGGGFLSRAAWDSATTHLERAVDLRPGYVFHRLELAQIYLDRDRRAEAREQLEHLLTLPATDVQDPAYKDEATRLLARLP